MNLKLGETLRALPGPILITGHTGFKGAWLAMLLEHLGVSTVGYSLAPDKDSLFDRAQMVGKLPEIFSDIRDAQTFSKFLIDHKPSVIIHMAAQPLVIRSYLEPKETFDINVMGTVNILDAAFTTDFVRAVVVVTTDKVYRNNNSGRAFVEGDPLEGKDPYSSSKVGAEAAVSAWQQIQKVSGGPKVVSVRAGNVVGGGDWAENRLIPDLIRGFISTKTVEIRNPTNTRPWQHVLDPLVGYLKTLEYLLNGEGITSINIAPKGKSLTVAEVARLASKCWGEGARIELSQIQTQSVFEAQTLSLDASYARDLFGVVGKWSQEESIMKSVNWWKMLLLQKHSPLDCVKFDIKEFLSEN